jgi:hypothetical protein
MISADRVVSMVSPPPRMVLAFRYARSPPDSA